MAFASRKRRSDLAEPNSLVLLYICVLSEEQVSSNSHVAALAQERPAFNASAVVKRLARLRGAPHSACAASTRVHLSIYLHCLWERGSCAIEELVTCAKRRRREVLFPELNSNTRWMQIKTGHCDVPPATHAPNARSTYELNISWPTVRFVTSA